MARWLPIFQLALFGGILRKGLERVRVDPVLEVHGGVENGRDLAGWGNRRRLLLEQFMQGFELFYADNDLCTIWARIRADARARGRPLSPQDAWIAATALALDAPLATNNRRHYEHVEKLRFLL